MRPSILIFVLAWPYYFNDLYLIFLQNSNLYLLWGLDLVFFTGIPIATLIWLEKKGALFPVDFGLSSFSLVSCLAAAVLSVPYYIGFELWGIPFLKTVLPSGPFKGYGFLEGPVLSYISIVYAALSAGFLEEIIFRGVVLTQLEKMLSSRTAVILVGGLIFAGIHWSQGPSKLAATFLIALPLAVHFILKRRLWPLITLHCCYDLIEFLR